MKRFSIGAAAETCGISPDTLRYYEKIGLVRPARTAGDRRVYDQDDLDRLGFIRRAQAVGFSLEEIGQLLRLRRDPGGCSESVRALAAGKLEQLDRKLDGLRRMHDELTLLLNLCSGEGAHCPILESLESNAGGDQEAVTSST